MDKSRKAKIAALILEMSYGELMEFCGELVRMQEDLASEVEEEWKPADLHGEYGLPVMLASWAEAACDD
jgi:hypothetical protein